ncbi:MAG: HD domain-containing protein [Nitrospirae bacterium]|nr:HD domain-containing protein [Nitrospirota bacterium]MCL5976530.1 HD domain-containing protein [Nitrospirota bacterium]
MEKSLIGALKTLTSLQRWNFLPRVEIWTEAENVAYVTHVGYAIGREYGLTAPDVLEHFLVRSLLKSFNKHFLSDIPVKTRDALDQDVWKSVVEKAVSETSKLFPRKISEDVKKYLTYGGDYSIAGADPKVKEKVEMLLKYVQNKVALEECETNQRVYDKNLDYQSIIGKIKKKTEEIADANKFEEIFDGHKAYFSRIKLLKYLRRWNKINRAIESSVLSHTFIVAFLTLLFSQMCNGECEENNFSYKAILKALFHDVPEALTGDLITPVKKVIKEAKNKAWDDVEEKLIEEIKSDAPKGVKEDFESYGLLKPLERSKVNSVDSLVKDCDELALVIECVFEEHSGTVTEEMYRAYHVYLNSLLNSEWTYIREFCTRVLLEFSLKNGR